MPLRRLYQGFFVRWYDGGMARIRHSDAAEDSPGFVTAYMERMESSDSLCLEFVETDRRGEPMVRFILTRAEAAGLISKMAMLLARGHAGTRPQTITDRDG